MHDFFKKIENSGWFNIATWCVIGGFSLMMLPEIFAKMTYGDVNYTPVLPPVITTTGYILTCIWFAFEMLVRFLANGGNFFRSRRNLFDLAMCALTFVPYCDWCAMLRLMRGIFTDNIEAPHRDERRGTMR